MIIIMNEKSWTKIRNKEKKQKSEKKSEMKLKKLTPLAAIILMTLILLVIVRKSEEPLSVETILKYTPENMILAACVLVLFFALKSLTIMFPLSILYLSSGVLFTPFIEGHLYPRATSQADMLACPFGDCHESQMPRHLREYLECHLQNNEM